MVSFAGNENGSTKYYSVCLSCAGKGWRPSGFNGFWQWLRADP
jgi:hypothetical protein